MEGKLNFLCWKLVFTIKVISEPFQDRTVPQPCNLIIWGPLVFVFGYLCVSEELFELVHLSRCNVNFLAKQWHFKLGTEMSFVMCEMCFLLVRKIRYPLGWNCTDSRWHNLHLSNAPLRLSWYRLRDDELFSGRERSASLRNLESFMFIVVL